MALVPRLPIPKLPAGVGEALNRGEVSKEEDAKISKARMASGRRAVSRRTLSELAVILSLTAAELGVVVVYPQFRYLVVGGLALLGVSVWDRAASSFARTSRRAAELAHNSVRPTVKEYERIDKGPVSFNIEHFELGVIPSPAAPTLIAGESWHSGWTFLARNLAAQMQEKVLPAAALTPLALIASGLSLMIPETEPMRLLGIPAFFLGAFGCGWLRECARDAARDFRYQLAEAWLQIGVAQGVSFDVASALVCEVANERLDATDLDRIWFEERAGAPQVGTQSAAGLGEIKEPVGPAR